MYKKNGNCLSLQTGEFFAEVVAVVVAVVVVVAAASDDDAAVLFALAAFCSAACSAFGQATACL